METSKERMERWTKVISRNILDAGCMDIESRVDKLLSIEAAVWCALTHLMEERHGQASKTDSTGA